jgi:hypothetical protein
VCIGLAGLVAGAPPSSADELLEKLQAIPGLTVVDEQPTSTGGRFFRLTYEQPVNHLKPWKGTFTQRASLYHQGETLPMVFYSGGYYYSPNPFRAEVTRILEGNQVNIEHRFFLPSRPAPADWSDLTIFQQYGPTTIAWRRARSITTAPGCARAAAGRAGDVYKKFIRDVDGLIAYVALNDVIDWHDSYACLTTPARTAVSRELAGSSRPCYADDRAPVVDYLIGLEPGPHLRSPDKA